MIPLASQEIDIAIMGRPPAELKTDSTPFAKHPMAFLAAPNHPLMSGPRPTMAMLSNERILVRERGSGTRSTIERLFKDAGLPLRIGSELSSNEAIKHMCAAGFGVAFLSMHTCVLEMRAGVLALLPMVMATGTEGSSLPSVKLAIDAMSAIMRACSRLTPRKAKITTAPTNGANAVMLRMGRLSMFVSYPLPEEIAECGEVDADGGWQLQGVPQRSGPELNVEQLLEPELLDRDDAEIDVVLGGHTDPSMGGPVKAKAIVKMLSDGEFKNDGPMNAGVGTSMGPTAVLRIGGIDVVTISNRIQTIDLQVFLSQGIDPRTKSVVVVKSVQHFRAAYAPIAREVILVDSGGICSPDIHRLKFTKLRRPIWPLDGVNDPYAGSRA